MSTTLPPRTTAVLAALGPHEILSHQRHEDRWVNVVPYAPQLVAQAAFETEVRCAVNPARSFTVWEYAGPARDWAGEVVSDGSGEALIHASYLHMSPTWEGAVPACRQMGAAGGRNAPPLVVAELAAQWRKELILGTAPAWFKQDHFRLGGATFHAGGQALYLFDEGPGRKQDSRLTWIAQGLVPEDRAGYEAMARAWLETPWLGQVRRPDGSEQSLAEAQAEREAMVAEIRREVVQGRHNHG